MAYRVSMNTLSEQEVIKVMYRSQRVKCGKANPILGSYEVNVHKVQLFLCVFCCLCLLRLKTFKRLEKNVFVQIGYYDLPSTVRSSVQL